MGDSTGTTPSMPIYTIFRDKHGIPQFSPKRGTQALKDALVYAFPTLETELQLMQAALKKFFDSEKGTHFICELPGNDLQTSLAKKRAVEISPIQKQKAGLRDWKKSSVRPAPRTSRNTSRAPSRTCSRSRPSSRASSCAREGSVDLNGGGLMTTWSLESGIELDKRKKAPYDPIKRRKVAENRGNACEKHRAAKSTECDPLNCPRNKMFGKVPNASPVDQDVIITGKKIIAGTSKIAAWNAAKTNEETVAITTSEIPACHEFVALPTDVDVFWDASDLVSGQPLPNFGESSISSYSGSWTDSSNTDSLPWSPDSSWLGATDSTRVSLVTAPAIPQLDSTIDPTAGSGSMARLVECNPPLSIPHACPVRHYPGLSYPTHADETSTEENVHVDQAARPDHTLACSDDPFMGWASKKANQIFDEYNWVLTHVETL